MHLVNGHLCVAAYIRPWAVLDLADPAPDPEAFTHALDLPPAVYGAGPKTHLTYQAGRRTSLNLDPKRGPASGGPGLSNR